MDKIELFNRLAVVVRPAFSDFQPITTLEIPLAETGLDSMDALTYSIYLDDIYGVSNDVSKDWTFLTPKDMFDLYEAHATKHPATVEEAMENVQ